MTAAVRNATPDDLPAIVELTRRARRRLAEWEPGYFAPADGADEAHEAHLTGLLTGDDTVARVVTDGDTVVGCALSRRQGDSWLVDDVAAADDGWWSDAMVDLFREVAERPALTCVPRKDIRRTGCCMTLGLRHRSSYWRLSLAGVDAEPPADVADSDPDGLPAPAMHTFAVDLAKATVLGDGAEGRALLAAPMAAPPVYDPGGTTGLVDRVSGSRRGALVEAAIARSADRGDVQLVVVCAEDDPVLEDTLVDRGFSRVVDVYTWPA